MHPLYPLTAMHRHTNLFTLTAPNVLGQRRSSESVRGKGRPSRLRRGGRRHRCGGSRHRCGGCGGCGNAKANTLATPMLCYHCSLLDQVEARAENALTEAKARYKELQVSQLQRSSADDATSRAILSCLLDLKCASCSSSSPRMRPRAVLPPSMRGWETSYNGRRGGRRLGSS